MTPVIVVSLSSCRLVVRFFSLSVINVVIVVVQGPLACNSFPIEPPGRADVASLGFGMQWGRRCCAAVDFT